MKKNKIMTILDFILSFGIIVIALGIIIYMFVVDAFSIGIFLALLIFLYIGIDSLRHDRFNLKNRHLQ